MVKAMVEAHLNPSRSFTAQDAAAISSVMTLVSTNSSCRVEITTHTVYRQVTKKFPVLGDYEDCWPVADAIRMRLKYTSSGHNA